MESDFINLIVSDTTVAGFVGSRVRPVVMSQGEQMPAVVVARVSGGPLYVDEGEVGLEEARIQVDCWSLDYTECKLLAAAIVSRLDQFSGEHGDTTFSLSMLDDERDMSESGANAAEYPMRISLDFIVWKRG